MRTRLKATITRCDFYLSFKRKPTYETYLETVKDRKIRVQYTKLRLSDHNLEIESGRHKKIERQQRLYLIRAAFFQKMLKRYPDLIVQQIRVKIALNVVKASKLAQMKLIT